MTTSAPSVHERSEPQMLAAGGHSDQRLVRCLDLYCGAGGAGTGYARAGMKVTGVDIKKQLRYPYDFHQGDALEYLAAHGHEYDVIHASPPCQRYSIASRNWNGKPKSHPDLVDATRTALEATGKVWVMENVIGAPMRNPLTLCGTMFGLGIGDAELRRHRLFESNVLLLAPPCNHNGRVIGVYGGHARNRTRTIGVYGEGARDSRRKYDRGQPDFSVQDARCAMGIEWMTLAELCEAIPPAYTEHIGRQLMATQ